MQAGQKSLLQTMLEAKSSIKFFLSFASKTFGLRIILMCSLGKSCHNFGKLYKGKTSSEIRLEWACCNWSKFRSCTVSAAKREPSTQKNRFEAENLYLMNTNEHFEHNWTMFSTL